MAIQDSELKYVKYNVNGQTYYDAIPNTGQTPYGSTELNYNDFLTGARQQGISALERYKQGQIEAPGVGQANRAAALKAFNEYGGQSALDALTGGSSDFNILARATGLKAEQFNPNQTSGITMVNGIPTQISAIQAEEANKAAVAAGTMKAVPIGSGFGYVPVGSAGDINLQNPITQPTGVYQGGITPVGSGVPSPNVGSPQLPIPNAPASNDAYYQSLTQQVGNLTTQLETERQRQLDRIQNDKANATTELENIRSSQEGAINQQGNVALDEKQAKLNQLDIEQKRFDENYTKVQGLGNELTSILTEGNALVAQMKGTTGLQNLRNPRINQAIELVNARAGVLTAAISTYSGQMNQAQSQLTLATNTLTSAYQDQLSYYSTLVNFYKSKASDTNQKLITLTKDERNFLDSKIASLENDVARVQANSDYIQGLMQNPTTALFMAQAGISLNDSPEVVNQKMAIQAKRQEAIDTQNEYVSKGYKPVAMPSADTITIQSGGQNLYFKPPTTKLLEVSAGASLIDPNTGRVVVTAPKTEIGLRGGTGLSQEAEAVLSGVLRLEDLTPSVKGRISGELSKAGYKSLPKISSAQQEDLAIMATVKGQIEQIETFNNDGKLEGVGAFGTGTLKSVLAQVGFSSEEGMSVRALIGSIKGTIAKLRGGTSFTTNEEKLLNTYVPSINDNTAVIINKITLLKDFINLKEQNLRAFSVERVLPQGSQEDLRVKYNY